MKNSDSSSKDIGPESVKQAGKVLQDIVAQLSGQPIFLFGIAAMLLAIVGLIALAIAPNMPSQLTWFPYALLAFGLVLIVLAWLKVPKEPKPEKDDTTKPQLVTLVVPTAGKLGLLVDLSHQQDKWKSNSIFDLSPGRSNLISLVIPPSDNSVWDIQEIKTRSHFQIGDLVNWRGLIFGMPYHELINYEVLNAIGDWVIQGGRLVLLGYELGERHHRTNLNSLSDRFFGLRFNSDIVAPENWRSSHAKPYGREITFQDVNSKKHPVLKGVQSLCMRNVCTLTVEPGSLIVLPIGKNGVSREVSPNYTDGWTSSGVQQFEIATDADWLPVIAEAPPGLCGKGKVIAIGTWDFFGTDECFKNSDNYAFVKNLLEWSVERN